MRGLTCVSSLMPVKLQVVYAAGTSRRSAGCTRLFHNRNELPHIQPAAFTSKENKCDVTLTSTPVVDERAMKDHRYHTWYSVHSHQNHFFMENAAGIQPVMFMDKESCSLQLYRH